MIKNIAQQGAIPQGMSPMAAQKVSLFQNLHSFNSKAVCLSEIERLIKFDTDVKNKSEVYRKMLIAIGKKEADDQVKQKLLPACSVAVLFNGAGRKVQHILSFTGLAFCDIDYVDDVDMAFELIKDDPHTLMVYITVSGNGLRIIYSYAREQSDIHIDSTSWKAAFLKGNSHFSSLVGQPYDNQCADYGHLCGLAHDEHVYVNDNAKPFIITDEEILQANFASGSEKGKPRKEYEPGSFETYIEDVWPKVQDILSKRNLVFQSGHHHDYVMHASFLFNRFGVDLEELLEWAAQEWSDYNDKQRDATIRSCYKKQDEHGTWKLNLSGRKKENSMMTLPEIAEWLQQRYELKYDEVTDMTYCRQKDCPDWKNVDTRTMCTIRRLMAEDSGKRVLKTDVQDVIWSDIAVSAHSVRDYLEALPKWDGTNRVSQLATFIDVEPAQTGQSAEEACELLEWAMHKWLVGNVGMWLRDDVVNHEMLILVGPQGIYKTSFFRHLLPDELKRFYWENNHNTFSSKDDQIALGENCLVEVEEFNITTPKEIGVLKSSLTANNIKERRPYARQREEKHRLAGFCGTCNEQFFLADETGNRRFLCFLVQKIKNPREWDLDYDQLYAQLRDEFLSGFQYWFNYNDEQRMAQQNEEFRLQSDEEMLICTFFRKPQPNESGELMNAANILLYINSGRLGYGLSSKKIGSIMRKLNFKSVHTAKGNFYSVVKIPTGEIQSEIAMGTENKEQENPEIAEGDLPF